MKKYVLLSAMVLALAAPSAARSQTAPSNGGGYGQQQGGVEQQFQEHKAEILKRLNEHLAEVQQRIGCVQAATNHEALRACLPEKGEGRNGNR